MSETVASPLVLRLIRLPDHPSEFGVTSQNADLLRAGRSQMAGSLADWGDSARGVPAQGDRFVAA